MDGRLKFLLLNVPVFVWLSALPNVTLYYPNSGKSEIGYIWNTQHRIFKRSLLPGGTTGDSGHIFPDKNFFMEVYWFGKRVRGCIQILPQWPRTSIYLDEDGRVDITPGSGTDLDRLRPCAGDEFDYLGIPAQRT